MPSKAEYETRLRHLEALLTTRAEIRAALAQEVADCRIELAEEEVPDPDFLDLVRHAYLTLHVTWYGPDREVDALEHHSHPDRDEALAGMTEFVFAWTREDYWHEGLLFDLDAGKELAFRKVQLLELEEG